MRRLVIAMASLVVVTEALPAPAAAEAKMMTDCYITVVGGHPIAILNAHGPAVCTFARVRSCAGDRIINTVKSTPKPVEITDRTAAKVEVCNLAAPPAPGKH